MALNKFKVCPACGEHNPPALLECKKCETDLTGVKVVDEALLAAQSAAERSAGPPSGGRSLIRLCDCGAENPPQARKCVSCGEDISDVRAAESKKGLAGSPPPALLRSFDGSFSYAITKPVTVIGREGEMSDYLQEKTYVSRKHAKVIIANGEVYMEDVSGTNHTFVNNAPIPAGAPTRLKNGDEVGLGGKLVNGERQTQAAYFVIEAPA
ncbi:MAG: FHA domain-containing protein [Gracilibacteraceae bacterium]|jgi:ribosomal protein L40E|nr:FHA domain-containing protein [Gracilibacteraceae bacterium]